MTEQRFYCDIDTATRERLAKLYGVWYRDIIKKLDVLISNRECPGDWMTYDTWEFRWRDGVYQLVNNGTIQGTVIGSGQWRSSDNLSLELEAMAYIAHSVLADKIDRLARLNQ